jgi:glycerol kinase
MMMNIGKSPIRSKNKLLTTIAWKIGNETHYALEGSIFIAGAVVQWLRDGLGIISSSADVEKLAAKVTDSGDVYFVPAFAGLGAPHWDQHARGTLVGLTRGSTAAHIARASLESIAYQTFDILGAMQQDSGIIIKELRVDGGATINNSLMQFQSDLLRTAVVRPRITETTALGAAYLAGLAVGYWNSINEISRQWQKDMAFTPAIPEPQAAAMIKGWHRAVKAAKAWAADR